MEGKKNVVFGFIYFIATASLGLVMSNMLGTINEKEAAKAQELSNLEQKVQSGFMMAETPGDAWREANSQSIMAINDWLKAEGQVGAIKGGPHAHGNLESVLNILVGFLLMFIAAPSAFKQLISWLFILAALLHSGMLYMVVMFQQGWALTVLNTGIGPIALLAGFLLMAIAAGIGLRPERHTF